MRKLGLLVLSIVFVVTSIAQEIALGQSAQNTLQRALVPISATVVWKFTDQDLSTPGSSPSLAATLRQDLKLLSYNSIALQFNIDRHVTSLRREVKLGIEAVLQSKRQIGGLFLAISAPNIDSGASYILLGGCSQVGQLVNCAANEVAVLGLSYFQLAEQIVPLCESPFSPVFTLSVVNASDPSNITLVSELATVDLDHICS